MTKPVEAELEDTVVFVDLVSFSKLPSSLVQFTVFKKLQALVGSAAALLGLVLEKDLLPLPTGDGFALVILKRGVRVAVKLAEEIQRTARAQRLECPMRIGIHHGTDHLVAQDIRGNTNIIGSSINLAQRVMDLGEKNHILLSDAAASVLRGTAVAKALHNLGPATLKHDVELPIYNYVTGIAGNKKIPKKLVEPVLEDPHRIVMSFLSRICNEVEALPAIKNSRGSTRSKPCFRATVLLHRAKKNDFFISRIRVMGDQPVEPSPIRFAPMKGVLEKVWSASGDGARKALGISLPPFHENDSSIQDAYFNVWQNLGTPLEIVKKFRRKGRFYLYIPLLKNETRIGILVLDALIPVNRQSVIDEIGAVVSQNLGFLEACLRKGISAIRN